MDVTPLKESETCSYVQSVVAKHDHDVTIQSGGLFALASLLEIDSYAASNLALEGKYDFIIHSVKRHSNFPTIVANGFQCLRSIIK